MIPSVSGDKQAVISTDMMFPGSELSWAGEGPRPNLISLGTVDGKLSFSGELSQTDVQGPIFVSKASEAINGVAFSGDLLGVSTRADIVIVRDFSSINNGKSGLILIDRGAHEIAAMPPGNFIAPVGKDGLLFIEPRDGGVVSTTVRLKETPFYNYKASVMGITPNGECVASVLRQDGLSVVLRNGDSWSGSRWTFSKLDIVDVTPITNAEFPFGLAVVGIDNSIHFVRDVFTDRKPRTFRFDGLSGKAYRLLSCNGHVFLLTSRRFYIFVDLASRFLGDSELDSPVTVGEFPCDPIDVNLAFGRDLLLLSPGRLEIIDVAQFSNPRIHDFSRKMSPHLDFEATYIPETGYTLVPM